MMDPNKGSNSLPPKHLRVSTKSESVEALSNEMEPNIEPNVVCSDRGVVVGSNHGGGDDDDGGGGGNGSSSNNNMLGCFSVLSLASIILILLGYLGLVTLANIQNPQKTATAALTNLAAAVPTFHSAPTWLINFVIPVSILPGLFVSLVAQRLNALTRLIWEPQPGGLGSDEKPSPSPPSMLKYMLFLAWNTTPSTRMTDLISSARVAAELMKWLASIRKRRPCYGWSELLSEGVVKAFVIQMMLGTVQAVPVTPTDGSETTRGPASSQSLWVADVIIMIITAAFVGFDVPQAIKALLEAAWAWLSAVIERRLEPLEVFDSDQDNEGEPPLEEDLDETNTVAAFAGDAEPPRASTEMVAFDYAIGELQGAMPPPPPLSLTDQVNAAGSWVQTPPRDIPGELDDDDLVDSVFVL